MNIIYSGWKMVYILLDKTKLTVALCPKESFKYCNLNIYLWLYVFHVSIIYLHCTFLRIYPWNWHLFGIRFSCFIVYSFTTDSCLTLYTLFEDFYCILWLLLFSDLYPMLKFLGWSYHYFPVMVFYTCPANVLSALYPNCFQNSSFTCSLIQLFILLFLFHMAAVSHVPVLLLRFTSERISSTLFLLDVLDWSPCSMEKMEYKQLGEWGEERGSKCPVVMALSW